MPRIPIIRAGANRPVRVDARVAHHLVRSKQWNYADPSDAPKKKVSEPKRASKVEDKRSGDEATETKTKEVPPPVKAGPMIHPPAPAAAPPKPMMLGAWSTPKPAPEPKTPSPKKIAKTLDRVDLHGKTKAELKTMANKLGVNSPSSDNKNMLVDRIYRYLRRDMRAAK